MNKELEIFRCAVCKELPTEPLLLDCLHSCCRQCTEGNLLVHRDADSDAAAGAPLSVFRCPTCQLDGRVTASDDVNLFATAKLRVAGMSGQATDCDLCPLVADHSRLGVSEPQQQEQADWWCSECCRALCDPCRRLHGLTVGQPHELLLLSDLCRLEETVVPALAAACPTHSGRKRELVCVQCEEFKCRDCIRSCASAGHEFDHVDSHGSRGGARGKEVVDGVARELRAELQSVQSAVATVAAGASLAVDLKTARRASEEALLRNKRLVLDVVDEACRTAQAELAELYDSLDCEADEASAAAQPVEAAGRQGAAYAACLLDSGDAVSMLSQRQRLHTCLRSVGERLRALPAVRPDARACVAIENAFSDDMCEIVRSWIGVPTRRFDILSRVDACKVAVAAAPGHEHSPAGARVQDAGSFRPRVSGLPVQLVQSTILKDGSDATSTTADSDCCFEVPVESVDLAVALDGASVLLATAEHGLIECDTGSGAELSSWTCATPDGSSIDKVTAVDVLKDGRIAVGLRHAQCIVLLRRLESSDGIRSWQRDGQVVNLQSWPARLATHGSDVIAVSESFPCQLVLISLPAMSRVELLRQKWDYYIVCVAVTSESVVTAGLARNEPLRDGSKGQLLECYTHSGTLRWRQLRKDEVLDLCAVVGKWPLLTLLSAPPSSDSDAATESLYLLVKGSSDVAILRADNGQRGSDVITFASSVGGEQPLQLQRLSLGRIAVTCSPVTSRLLLAALTGAGKMVVTHRLNCLAAPVP